MSTGAIILFVLAIILIIIGITLAIYTKIPEYLFFVCFAIMFGMIGLAIQYPIPNDDDVKEGTAHYVEQNYIEVINGDTINNYKTYRIEWIKNTK